MRFIRKIVDVTSDVLGAVPDIAGGEERSRLVAEHAEAVKNRFEAENPGMEISVKPFFGGNQFFAFVIEVFRTCGWSARPRRRSASSAVTPTTGCGRVIRAILDLPGLCRTR